MFPPFIISDRACMTISRSTLALARSAKNINDNNVFCMSSQKDDSR